MEDEEYLLKENILGILYFKKLEQAEQFVFIVRTLEIEVGKIAFSQFNSKS